MSSSKLAKSAKISSFAAAIVYNTTGNDQVCHHFRLVFTDGACSHNGQDAATSGIGTAYGESERSQHAVPLTKPIDQGHKRTSQRAEL